jgi:FtsZ-binding cell division protein ZapB
MTLGKFEVVNNVLNITIDVVAKTVGLLYQKAQGLQEKQQQLQSTNEDLKTALDSLKQTVRELCGEPKDVSTYKVEAVTVLSVHLIFRYVKFGSHSKVSEICYTVFIMVTFGEWSYITGLYVLSSFRVLNWLCEPTEAPSEVCGRSLILSVLQIQPI